jgi:3',5'-cyclic AMP phosphodiesterase CpdA
MRGTVRASCRVLILPLLLLAAWAAPAAGEPGRALRSLDGSEAHVAAGQDLVFVVGGDNRPTERWASLPPVLSTILEEVRWIKPDLVLWSGDTVYGYCDSRDELAAEYARFARLAPPGIPLYNAPGNHEIHADISRCKDAEKAAACAGRPCADDVFRHYFGALYGSFDVGDVHFIALDAEHHRKTARSDSGLPQIGPRQMRWLAADLAAHKGARAIFVFLHSELYSSPLIDSGAGTSHPSVAQRVELHELFRRYPVKAVFSGHEHIFWHEPPENHDWIHYFVAGGAGAPLYAPPEHGGFAHYLVVQVTGSGGSAQVSYTTVEPGHLGVGEGAVTPDGETLWLANGNDTGSVLLPVRGLVVALPAREYGSCSDVQAGLQVKAACTEAADGLRVSFERIDLKSGKSVKLWVGHKKAGDRSP